MVREDIEMVYQHMNLEDAKNVLRSMYRMYKNCDDEAYLFFAENARAIEIVLNDLAFKNDHDYFEDKNVITIKIGREDVPDLLTALSDADWCMRWAEKRLITEKSKNAMIHSMELLDELGNVLKEKCKK